MQVSSLKSFKFQGVSSYKELVSRSFKFQQYQVSRTTECKFEMLQVSTVLIETWRSALPLRSAKNLKLGT